MKKIMNFILFILLIVNNNTVKTQDAGYSSIRAILSLSTLALTGAVVKIINESTHIKEKGKKIGVRQGELAVMTGVFGGLLSLSTTIPETLRYPWMTPTPICYISYKIGTSNLFSRYMVQNVVPLIGEHLASEKVLALLLLWRIIRYQWL